MGERIMASRFAGRLDDLSAVRVGVSTDEIVDIALANEGENWDRAGCAAFTWGISNLAGLPFFDPRDSSVLLEGNDSTRILIPDGGHIVPHSWDPDADGEDEDGWELIPTHNSVAGLLNTMEPGDIVRIYAYRNVGEKSFFETEKGAVAAHSFIVVSNDGNGNVVVIDNWNGRTIERHSFDDIVRQFAVDGHFQSAFVSRIDTDWVNAGNVDLTSIEGNGVGTSSTRKIGEPDRIGGPDKIDGPDLTVSDFFLAAHPRGPHFPVVAEFTVDNRGGGSGRGDLVDFDLIFSTDRRVDAQDPHIAHYGFESITAEYPWELAFGFGDLPEGLMPGRYYLAVIADPQNTVAESHENNNVSNFVEITILGPSNETITGYDILF
jgi:hypothetical protein